ncbi:hypothetical protein [Nocardia sp. NBC_01009]|uniref:hypothetical protein n=1 Tax=Nocardia sp. NBC_01009 TaxID=2975996 RepID=UPI00386DE8BF|nr:hypothetical protein OHA42_32400 [Nocardia sp. NBC_01009]
MRRPPRALVALVADQLRRVREADPSLAVVPDLDAELILATTGGLAQGMLPGHSTAQSAVELVEHLLDRVLGAA